MAILSGNTIASTFSELLRLGNSTLSASAGTSHYIKDAADTNSALSINTTRVGIGTTAPQNLLHIHNTSDAIAYAQFTNSATNATATDGTFVGIDAQEHAVFLNYEAQPMDFYTTNVKRMTILADGKVGIGTDAPDQLLHLESAAPMMVLEDSTGNATTDEAWIHHQKSGAAGTYLSSIKFDRNGGTSGLMSFLVNNGSVLTAMTIRETGYVGIGTEAPATTLHLAVENSTPGLILSRNSAVSGSEAVGNGNTLGNIMFYGYDSQYSDGVAGAKITARASGHWDFTGSSQNDAPCELQFFTEDDSSTNQITAGPRMVIDKNGNVGIGTETPGSILHLDSDADTTLTIERDNVDDTAQIIFDTENGSAVDWFMGLADSGGSGSGDEFFIGSSTTTASGATTGTPALWIEAAGNVGIGETAPEFPLHVTHPNGTDNIYCAKFENQDTGEPAGIRIDYAKDSSAETGDDPYIACNDSTGTQFVVWGAGNIQAGYTYSNDVGATYRDMQVDDDGHIGYQASTGRVKGNIVDMENISWLYNLKPRNFEYKEFEYVDKTDSEGNVRKVRTGNRTETLTGIKEYGLIAEEVEKVAGAERFVSYNKDGVTPEGVSYNKLITVLLKAVQELSAKVTALENA